MIQIAEHRMRFNEARAPEPPEDILVRMEKLRLNALKRPRILVNNEPLDLTVNETLLKTSRRSIGKSNISLPDIGVETSQPIWKSYEEQTIGIKDICSDLRTIPYCRSHNTSFVSLPEDIANSSGYCSGRSSAFFKSHDELANESGHSFSLPEIASETSGSGHESSFLVNDTMDLCNYRATSSRYRQEPSTPTKGTKWLTGNKWNCVLSPITSMTSSPKVASPLQMPDFDNIVESDDLNDTLERINYRLAMCGAKSPSPTKMAKKRQLMQVYVTELLQNEKILQQEAASKEETSTCKSVAMDTPIPIEMVKTPVKIPGPEIKGNAVIDKSAEKKVDEQLISLGCHSPTPYKIAKRKQLMEELLTKSKTQSKPRLKRTISVDTFKRSYDC